MINKTYTLSLNLDTVLNFKVYDNIIIGTISPRRMKGGSTCAWIKQKLDWGGREEQPERNGATSQHNGRSPEKQESSENRNPRLTTFCGFLNEREQSNFNK